MSKYLHIMCKQLSVDIHLLLYYCNCSELIVVVGFGYTINNNKQELPQIIK